MAQPTEEAGLPSLERPGWKTFANWGSAILLALIFLASGIWKINDAQAAAARMTQALVPQALSLPAALLFGIAETLAGALVLVPRFRRWGAWLCALLLLAFMAYVGAQYQALLGVDCTCFPWVKRVVGPGFFVGDGVMLLLAVAAAIWSRPPSSFRSAVLVAGAVTVFALVSYGVAAVRQTGAQAPDSVLVDGKPYSLQQGKILVFFFHPACMHCYDVAQRLSKYNWNGARTLAVPVEQPEYAAGFLSDTGLKAPFTTDFEKLRGPLGYKTYPAAAALENGRVKEVLLQFDPPEPEAALKRLGFVQ